MFFLAEAPIVFTHIPHGFLFLFLIQFLPFLPSLHPFGFRKFQVVMVVLKKCIEIRILETIFILRLLDSGDIPDWMKTVVPPTPVPPNRSK